MSQHISEQPRIQDIIDAVRVPYKCRIPQRLQSERHSGVQYRNKVNNTDVMSPPGVATALPVILPTCSNVLAVLRSGLKGNVFRTKSSSRAASDKGASSQIHDTSRSTRSCRDRNPTTLKSATAKRSTNDQKHKVVRPVITVPVQQKSIKTLYPAKNYRMLPDQKIINRYEELEVQQSDQSNDAFEYNDPTESSGGIKPEKEQIGDISSEWQINHNEFQTMKIKLESRQKVEAVDHNENESSTDDTCIRKDSKKACNQLPKINAESKFKKICDTYAVERGLAINVKNFYNVPSKLVATCEKALTKRQEIIDWLDSIKTKVSNSNLAKKINEFNSENEMLRITLTNVKTDFIKELQEIEHFIRQRVDDTASLHLQVENMTYKLSELNAHNSDLRKQISTAENCRSYVNKYKITNDLLSEIINNNAKYQIEITELMQMQAMGKDSKEKHKILKDRLSKTEEAKVKELQERNQKLQKKYDEELKELNESVKESTMNLEKIAQDRDRLQTEKDELEKKLVQLSQYYNESLNNNSMEMKLNIAKLVETETKYNIEIEEKNKLKSHYCEQLLKAEMRNNELEKKLQEIEDQLKHEHKNMKDELEKVCLENKNYNNLLLRQTEATNKTEENLKIYHEENQNLKQDVEKQQKYILEFKNQEDSLKGQLQESEATIKSYEHQLKDLRENIDKEQKDDSNEIKTLHEKITKQEAELIEVNIKNNRLSESLEKLQIELKNQLETHTQQEHDLRKKDDVIKSLSNVEEEQSSIIKQLRSDIQHKTNTDAEFIQQIERKNFEINSLSNNLDIRNEQILQLEKIILTLEDKARTASSQQKKYENTIHLLEMKIKMYESCKYSQGVDATSRNLDQFLQLLEDEIAKPIPNDMKNVISSKGHRQKMYDESKKYATFHDRCHEKQFQNMSRQEMSHIDNDSNENSVNSACFSSNEELHMYDKGIENKVNIDENDSYVNYKKRSIESQKSNDARSRENVLANKLRLLALSKSDFERKSKMFALAGHRL